jgi:hypothetical protein
MKKDIRIWVTLKRAAVKIRSLRSPLIMGRREMAGKWVNWLWIEKIWGLEFWEGGFQRRGADVSVPEIGSRVGQKCFGGISGIYADSRRELKWGNLNLSFARVSTWGRWGGGGSLCTLGQCLVCVGFRFCGVKGKARGVYFYGSRK